MRAHCFKELRIDVEAVVMLSPVGIAAVACGFAGYASGLDPHRTGLPVFISISQQPMMDTLVNLSAFNQ
jgi:hypothetical protein